MEEALIKRVLPHSVEAEQSVIGSMLMDRDAIMAASEIITGEDFYQHQYGVLFEAMVELYNEGKPVDLVTLQDRLREKEVPPEISSMEFVREHYGERISLADAAGLLSITPEHFCRLFRKYTGQTFLAYVNQIRMEHFHTDLLETDKNITFLLDKNGITNYKGFLRKFKEAYGESPKEVRRRKN